MKELPSNKIDTSIVWYRRFLNFVEHRWEARSPGSHRIFRAFRSGVSGLVTDFQDFVTVWTRVSAGAPYRDLAYREIALLRLVPRELVRATPTLFISALPGTVLFLPLLFYFPRVFLTEHFWTPEQRLQFTNDLLAKRRSHYRRLVEDLATVQQHVESEPLRLALENVHSGRRNSLELLASTAVAFEHDCLQFDYLSYRHSIHLCRCSGISALRLYREYRLWRQAKILFEEDRAVERSGFAFQKAEGDPPAARDILRHQYCLARGFQSLDKPPAVADRFVRDWCQVTKASGATGAGGDQLVEQRMSFLLHLPCLMDSSVDVPAGGTAAEPGSV